MYTSIEPCNAPVVPGFIAFAYGDDLKTVTHADLSYRCPECGDVHYVDDYGKHRTPLSCTSPGADLEVRQPHKGEVMPPDPDDEPDLDDLVRAIASAAAATMAREEIDNYITSAWIVDRFNEMQALNPALTADDMLDLLISYTEAKDNA
jgi:hypothetical protein